MLPIDLSDSNLDFFFKSHSKSSLQINSLALYHRESGLLLIRISGIKLIKYVDEKLVQTTGFPKVFPTRHHIVVLFQRRKIKSQSWIRKKKYNYFLQSYWLRCKTLSSFFYPKLLPHNGGHADQIVDYFCFKDELAFKFQIK